MIRIFSNLTIISLVVFLFTLPTSALDFSLSDSLEDPCPSFPASSSSSSSSSDSNPYFYRKTSDHKRDLFFPIHKALWERSPLYKKIWKKVSEKRGTPLAITANRDIEQESHMDFVAFAIVIKDHQKHPQELQSLIVLQLAKAYHETDFNQLNKKAITGEFFRQQPNDDAGLYARNVVWQLYKSKDIHRRIKNEIDSQYESETVLWSTPTPAPFSNYDYNVFLTSAEAAAELDYYATYYAQQCRPNILAYQAKQELGHAGDYAKVDGKWVEWKITDID